jgi:hypothetical protein
MANFRGRNAGISMRYVCIYVRIYVCMWLREYVRFYHVCMCMYVHICMYVVTRNRVTELKSNGELPGQKRANNKHEVCELYGEEILYGSLRILSQSKDTK